MSPCPMGRVSHDGTCNAPLYFNDLRTYFQDLLTFGPLPAVQGRSCGAGPSLSPSDALSHEMPASCCCAPIRSRVLALRCGERESGVEPLWEVLSPNTVRLVQPECPMKPITVIATLLLMGANSATAGSGGILCILPLSADAVIDEMSGAPPSMVGKPLPTYEIRINDGEFVPVDKVLPTPVTVAERGRHLVRIYADGKLDTSFHLRFSDYPSPVLSLGMSEIGYQTWLVTPVETCR